MGDMITRIFQISFF